MIRHCVLATALAASGLVHAQHDARPDPYARPDNSWITLGGTVVRTAPAGFSLNYGDGHVAVEMDTPGGSTSGYRVRPGDRVTVTGVIDDDLFERTSIEASAVYVEALNTHFFASSVDEEDVAFAAVAPVVPSKAAVVGTVSKVDGQQLTVQTGRQTISVDASKLPGTPRAREGDRVSVVGNIDRGFFQRRVLVADSIVGLAPVAGRAASDVATVDGDSGDQP